MIAVFFYLSELDVNCSDNNNVNIEYLQCPRVHVIISKSFLFKEKLSTIYIYIYRFKQNEANVY